MDDEKVMVPLETVVRITSWLYATPTATVMEVMGEFDLSYDEALAALTTARLVILRLEIERLGRVFPNVINIMTGRKPRGDA